MSSPKSRSSIGAIRNPETDAAILAAARALLEEVGYARFSLSEVARRARSSKPTLYRRWPNKAALIFELYGAERRGSLALPDTGSLRSDLVTLNRTLWRFWRETPTGTALRAVIAEAQADPAALELIRSMAVHGRPEALWRLFERAKERKLVPQSYDTESAVRLVLAFNWMQLLLDQLNNEDVIEGMASLILGACAE